MSTSEAEVLDEIFDARWDRTKILLQDRDGSRWKRRLDSIARLIENSSTCAAILIEDNSFLIATNKEFPRGEDTEDQGYRLIDSVMSYFKDVSEGKDSQENFREVFKQICNCAMSGLQLLKYVRDELGGENFIQRIIDSGATEDFRKLRDYISENAELGHFPKDAGAAFVVCHALLQDFNKVIKFIRANKDKAPDGSPTARFINAIKSYNESNIIDQSKLRGKVADTGKMHAEMRLISLIEGKLRDEGKYQNYIGISKLCCLDCHCIIHGVNQAEGYNNRIEIRGAHNVSHPGNWRAPFNITGQQPLLLEAPKVAREPGGRISKTNSVRDAFASAVLEAYKAARHGAGSGARDVSEYHESSQHSGDENEERLIHEILHGLETEYKKLKEMSILSIPGIIIDENIFRVIEQLLKDLQEEDTSLRNWVLGGGVRNIADYIKILNNGEDITTLNYAAIVGVAIFRNSTFVGKKISERFSEVDKALSNINAKEKIQNRTEEAVHQREFSNVFKNAYMFWNKKGNKYDDDWQLQLAISLSLEEDESFKRQKDYLSGLGQGDVEDVPHDGFCLFHVVAKQIRKKSIKIDDIEDPNLVTTKSIIKLVENHLEQNWRRYEDSLVGNSVDEKYAVFLGELEKYLTLGEYNQNVGDLMPRILSDALGVSIVVHDALTQRMEQFNEQQEQLIRLGRVNNNHYMIIFNKESLELNDSDDPRSLAASLTDDVTSKPLMFLGPRGERLSGHSTHKLDEPPPKKVAKTKEEQDVTEGRPRTPSPNKHSDSDDD